MRRPGGYAHHQDHGNVADGRGVPVHHRRDGREQDQINIQVHHDQPGGFGAGQQLRADVTARIPGCRQEDDQGHDIEGFGAGTQNDQHAREADYDGQPAGGG